MTSGRRSNCLGPAWFFALLGAAVAAWPVVVLWALTDPEWPEYLTRLADDLRRELE